jgi:CRP-like cAMP-binding protein
MEPVAERSRFASFFGYFDSPDSGDFLFLRDRTEDDWRRLLGYAETRLFRTGDLIIRAGETDRALYIVASGRLEVLRPGDSGELHRVSSVEPRSVTGEMAFVDARPRSATIRALTDGELHRLTWDQFEILAARYPELGRAILLDIARILAARLREAGGAAPPTR